MDYVKIGFFASPDAVGLRRGARAGCRASQADRRPVCRSAAGFRIAAGAGQIRLPRRHGRHGGQVERAACSTICRRSAFRISSMPPRPPAFGRSGGSLEAPDIPQAFAVRSGLSRFSRCALQPVAAHRGDRRASGRADTLADSGGAAGTRLRERRLSPAGGPRLRSRHRRSDARDRQDLRARFRASGARSAPTASSTATRRRCASTSPPRCCG